MTFDIGLICSIIGLLITVFTFIYGIYIKRNRVIKFSEVVKCTDIIAEKLKAINFIPDVLISFPKGGLIVADLIGHLFNNDLDIISIHTKRQIIDNDVNVIVRDSYVNYQAIKHKKLLIIDDVLENGKTMATIKEILIKNGVPKNSIKTAVLGKTEAFQAVFQPDFSVFTYFRNKKYKLFFPWGKVTL